MKQPVFYSKELYNVIMLRVAAGDSIAKICRTDDMPDRANVFEWIHKTEENAQQYARAVEKRATARVDRLDEYGDMVLKGEITSDVARVLIDKERWQAGKENPKRYSDKTQLEISGKDGEPLSLRLIAAQQRLLKDITPQTKTIEHVQTITPDDVI